ncbi:hypothetical protein BDF21DRAFT_432076 [Thamnidium elegans]|nr:hypothetical protein BDF21DRAFT_432076 [Thamnidium elegans]
MSRSKALKQLILVSNWLQVLLVSKTYLSKLNVKLKPGTTSTQQTYYNIFYSYMFATKISSLNLNLGIEPSSPN